MRDGKSGAYGVCDESTREERSVSGAASSVRCADGLPGGREACRGARLTFGRAMAIAAEQVGLDGFKAFGIGGGADWQLARELCKIIAEVMMMRDEGEVKISGEMLDAYLVKEVFAEIRSEHVAWVMETIRTRGAGNALRKFYVRSMLYNSVFEMETAAQSGIECGWAE